MPVSFDHPLVPAGGTDHPVPAGGTSRRYPPAVAYIPTRRIHHAQGILARRCANQLPPRDEEGATAIEYALIIGVASIAIVAALALIAPAITTSSRRTSSTGSEPNAIHRLHHAHRIDRVLSGRGRRATVKELEHTDDPTSVREGRSGRRVRPRAAVAAPALFALVDFGWVFNQQLAVSSAAREGARYYAIHHGDTTPDPVAEAEARAANLVSTADLLHRDHAVHDAADATATVAATTPITELTGLVQGLAGGPR